MKGQIVGLSFGDGSPILWTLRPGTINQLVKGQFMMTVTELVEWLARVPGTARIGIDEGGLTLVAIQKGQAVDSYEMGGITVCRCVNCDWQGVVEELNDAKDISERCAPDDLPVGECPKCGAIILDEVVS